MSSPSFPEYMDRFLLAKIEKLGLENKLFSLCPGTTRGTLEAHICDFLKMERGDLETTSVFKVLLGGNDTELLREIPRTLEQSKSPQALHLVKRLDWAFVSFLDPYLFHYRGRCEKGSKIQELDRKLMQYIGSKKTQISKKLLSEIVQESVTIEVQLRAQVDALVQCEQDLKILLKESSHTSIGEHLSRLITQIDWAGSGQVLSTQAAQKLAHYTYGEPRSTSSAKISLTKDLGGIKGPIQKDIKHVLDKIMIANLELNDSEKDHNESLGDAECRRIREEHATAKAEYDTDRTELNVLIAFAAALGNIELEKKLREAL